MTNTLEFPVLLRLLDERSAAFRTAVGSAPGLDLPVPTCPGWTLLDLAHHIGLGRRRWAAIVAAGPADTPPADAPSAQIEDNPTAPRDRDEVLPWLAESTDLLLNALREAGPDRGTWAWWVKSQSPRTSGAVARHQLQQMAVHTYDAQAAAGAPQPLPAEVALEGVDEFQSTCCATTSAWPHDPAVVDYHATEGRSWRVELSPGGAKVTELSEPGAEDPDVSVRATASDLVLLFYGRVGLDSMQVEGDRKIIDQLADWDPGV